MLRLLPGTCRFSGVCYRRRDYLKMIRIHCKPIRTSILDEQGPHNGCDCGLASAVLNRGQFESVRKVDYENF